MIIRMVYVSFVDLQSKYPASMCANLPAPFRDVVAAATAAVMVVVEAGWENRNWI